MRKVIKKLIALLEALINEESVIKLPASEPNLLDDEEVHLGRS